MGATTEAHEPLSAVSITFSVPAHMAEALERAAEARLCSKATVLRQALAEHLLAGGQTT